MHSILCYRPLQLHSHHLLAARLARLASSAASAFITAALAARAVLRYFSLTLVNWIEAVDKGHTRHVLLGAFIVATSTQHDSSQHMPVTATRHACMIKAQCLPCLKAACLSLLLWQLERHIKVVVYVLSLMVDTGRLCLSIAVYILNPYSLCDILVGRESMITSS